MSQSGVGVAGVAGVAHFRVESESGVGVVFLNVPESESGLDVGSRSCFYSYSGVGVGDVKS